MSRRSIIRRLRPTYRTVRVEARCTPRERKLLEQGAAAGQMSVSELLRTGALREARSHIARAREAQPRSLSVAEAQRTPADPDTVARAAARIRAAMERRRREEQPGGQGALASD